VTCIDECVLFFDLEAISWLFEGHGDFQFEIYRMMREETKLVKIIYYKYNINHISGKTGKDFIPAQMYTGWGTCWKSFLKR